MYSVLMSEPMRTALTVEEVRHVAKLARLKLTDDQISLYQVQLEAILEHIATLEKLDVTGVEPMTHPTDLTNRFDDDEVAAPMPIADLLRNAPNAGGGGIEDRYLAVPKVLADEH